MKRNLLFTVLAMTLFVGPVLAQVSTAPAGAWAVTYTIGDTTRTFTFVALENGTGTFRFRAPSATVRSIFPAVWAHPAPNKTNFSSEVQLQVSNTLRETGALVFKGTRGNDGRLTGPVIFVVDNAIGATPAPFSIRTGMFTAVPLTATGGRQELTDVR